MCSFLFENTETHSEADSENRLPENTSNTITSKWLQAWNRNKNLANGSALTQRLRITDCLKYPSAKEKTQFCSSWRQLGIQPLASAAAKSST